MSVSDDAIYYLHVDRVFAQYVLIMLSSFHVGT